jgi:hypothetical protein
MGCGSERDGNDHDRTAWFAKCGRGVFCHWLACCSVEGPGEGPADGSGVSADQWNRWADALGVNGLAGQLAEVKAPYFFITIGQNSGHGLHADEPNFRSFAAARRAGNPDSITGFNFGTVASIWEDGSGRYVRSLTEEEDCTAGEQDRALSLCPGPWVELNGHRARWHGLTYLGVDWRAGRVERAGRMADRNVWKGDRR